MTQPSSFDSATSAFAANALIVLVAVFARGMLTIDADWYYLSIQEDEYVEWASFWAFVAAGYVYLRTAFRPAFAFKSCWLLLSLAAFCLFVACEEISWGQRLIGYRPPEYFLELNFQQELNVHNIMDTDLRKLAMQFVIFGYGVALPIAMRVPPIGRLLGRYGVVAPPAALIPAFAVTGVFQVTYPIKFTGEWVELMLGFCFLFAAGAARRGVPESGVPKRVPPAARIAIIWAAVLGVGLASATATRYQRDRHPGTRLAAESELAALKQDFEVGYVTSRCGLHKRLYTFVVEYGQDHLLEGAFAGLEQQGMPEQRAAYLLDPWNYAYWLRDNCASDDRERITYLYSFGPNRRRDSTPRAIGGDDIAVFLRGQP